MNKQSLGEAKALRAARLETVREFVKRYTQVNAKMPSLHKLTNQDLHLLAAAIDAA